MARRPGVVLWIAAWCVLAGSSAAVEHREGRYPARQEPRGWCCRNGDVFPAAPPECEELRGRFTPSELEAHEICRREEPPPEGWCCRDGDIFPASPPECEELRGRFTPSEREAHVICRREEPPPEGWCCRDGDVFPASPPECEELRGRFTPSEREAHVICRREEPPPEGWCCRDGDVFPASPHECEELGGRHTPSEREAHVICRREEPRFAGWCCRDRELLPANRHACDVLGGAFYDDPESGELECRSEPAAVGWCCADGEVTAIDEVDCRRLGGEHSAEREQAEDRCRGPRQLISLPPRVRHRATEITKTAPILIEDVSPGPRTVAERGSTQWGRLLDLAGSGFEKIIGPVTASSLQIGFLRTERLAARTTRNQLLVYYWGEGFGTVVTNVSEQTGIEVSGPPVAWVTKDGSNTIDHLAARSKTGDLIVFYWSFGKNWKAVNVSQKTGVKIDGPATPWRTSNGPNVVEHLAARSPSGDLTVFYWQSGQDWKAVNVSQKTGVKIAGPTTAWTTPDGSKLVEHLAARSTSGDLTVFYWLPGQDWKAVNVSQKTGVKIAGPATAWTTPDGSKLVEHLAARSMSGDLTVFYWLPGQDWKAVNVSQKTGVKVSGAATAWTSRNGPDLVEHLAASAADGDLTVFYWLPGQDWKAVNVSQKTGVRLAARPTSWISTRSYPQPERVAGQARNGHLLVLSWQSGGDWYGTNLSTEAAHRVIYGASPLAGVWKSTDQGNTWKQLVRPQPAEGAQTRGALGSQTVYEVAVSPVDPDLVLAAVHDTLRADGSAGGVYRSTDGGASWQHVHPPISPSNMAAQVRFAPDDPKLVYAAMGTSVARSGNAGDTWQDLTPSTLGGRRIWHVAVAPMERNDVRRVYACGPANFWYSVDGGDTWREDFGLRSITGLPPYGPGNLAGISPDGKSVWRWTGEGGGWQQIGGAAAEVYAGGWEVFATEPASGDVYRYDGVPLQWTKIGGPGKRFAADGRGVLYKIASDGKSVWRYDGKPMKWTKIGGSAAEIYVSGWDGNWQDPYVYATDPVSGVISSWNATSGAWTAIGGAGKMFAVDHSNRLYGLSPDGKSIWRYDGTPNSWTEIGGAASMIAVNNGSLFATDGKEILRWDGTPKSWTKVGGPSSGLLAAGADLFSIQPGTGDIHRFDVEPGNWSKIGGPGKKFAAAMLPTISARFGDAPTTGNGEGSQILEVEPGRPDHVYLAFRHLTDGPRYFAQVKDATTGGWLVASETDGAPANTYAALSPTHQSKSGRKKLFMDTGEGSLWLGDFSQFSTSSAVTSPQRATWKKMPGTPQYWGGSTPSGRTYVHAQPSGDGYVLVFSDRSHVHLSVGRPRAGEWHRLDGLDLSTTWWKSKIAGQGALANRLSMHVDPHAVLISPRFELQLKKPSSQIPPAYAKNRELSRHVRGTIWLANDGGVYSSDDGGTFWQLASSGPAALLAVNLAGVAKSGTKGPALYFGVADNDDFFSLDGGLTWKSPYGNCGDCGHWYADPAQPDRVVEMGAKGRKGERFLVYDGAGSFPDAANSGIIGYHDYPQDYFLDLNYGSETMVFTTAGESPLPFGDHFVIQKKPDGTRWIMRAANGFVGVFTIYMPHGPALPAGNLRRAQASGGHAKAVFFVGDGNKVWRYPPLASGAQGKWQEVVAGGGASAVKRFLVNPYDSDNLYTVDLSAIRRTDDGGKSWKKDTQLDDLLSVNDTLDRRPCGGSNCIFTDLVVDRSSPKRRFALGKAGVFYTLDGFNWKRLMDALALPCRPVRGYFDPISDPADPALYVGCDGRGILKIHPVP